MTRIDDGVYQGSFDTPSGPGGVPVFKGLEGTPNEQHYVCEYFHVLGYTQGIEACKGVD